MPVVEDFLKEAAYSDVEVLPVGADAELGAYAEIFGKDDAGYVGHGERGAEIFGVFLARSDGSGEPILIGSGKQDGARDANLSGVVVGHKEQAKVAGRLGKMQVIAEGSLFDGEISIDHFRRSRQRQTDTTIVRIG